MQPARKIIRLAHEQGIGAVYENVGVPCPRTVVQLGGSHPEELADAYEILADAQYPEVNLNLGCPSDSVQAGQFGAALMKSPQKVHTILRTIDSRRRSIPFTVKCRIGVDELDSDAYFIQFVQTLLADTALDHVIVHARKAYLKGLSPKENRTVPPINYERVYMLRKIAPHLHITLNGGITTVDQIKEQLAHVDGVMLGRRFREDPMFIQTLDHGIYIHYSAL
ncbi:tRNA-dihydrouridine synthase [Syncephalis fuscata]|nr:tRNA-dihydrouridine synthase [Syncephalis fuscata]